MPKLWKYNTKSNGFRGDGMKDSKIVVKDVFKDIQGDLRNKIITNNIVKLIIREQKNN